MLSKILLREIDLFCMPTLSHQFSAKNLFRKKNFNTPAMKKLIYIVMLCIVSAGLFTACAKEEVKPTKDITVGGGLFSDPK